MLTHRNGKVTANDVAGQPADHGGLSARRWFPLRGDMMQAEDFLNLSPCEKVVLLDINYRLSEHLSLVRCGLRHSPFIESDAKWAKRLCMSHETFQNARCAVGQPKDKKPKTQGLGWITYTSGYRTPDGELRRTEYHDAI